MDRRSSISIVDRPLANKLLLHHLYFRKLIVMFLVGLVLFSSFTIFHGSVVGVSGKSYLPTGLYSNSLNSERHNNVNNQNFTNYFTKLSPNSDPIISKILNMDRLVQNQNSIKPSASSQMYTYQLQALGLSSGREWNVEVVEYNSLASGFNNIIYSNTSSSVSMTIHTYAGIYEIIYGVGLPDLTEYFVFPAYETTVYLKFPTLYASTFTETGLFVNANYSLKVEGANVSYNNHTTTTSMVAYLPNGTYKVYGGINTSALFIEDVKVIGGSISVNINFPSLYKVTFLKGKAPSLSTWGVYLFSATFLVNFTVSNVFLTSDSSIQVYLPSGYYRQSDYLNSTYFTSLSSPFEINSSSVNIIVNFPNLYRVSFMETGLSSNLTWGIEVIGTSFDIIAEEYEIPSSSIQIFLPDGIYTWTGSVIGTSTKVTGEFGVTGQSITEKITFNLPVLHKITFTENGLTTGASWGVSIQNKSGSYLVSNSSVGSTISMYVPDGNFNYTIEVGSLTTETKPLTVSGNTILISVTLPSLFRAEFIESGLMTGSTWSVAISNSNSSFILENSSSGSTINTLIPIGQFNYTLEECTYSSSYEPYNIKTNPYPFRETGAFLTTNVVLPHLVPVTFNIMNLTLGYCWEISVSNASSTVNFEDYGLGHSVLLYLPDGSFTFSADEFTVSTLNFLGIYPTNLIYLGSVSFNVGISPETIKVNFPELFKITVEESGLNIGVKWGINIYNEAAGSYSSSNNVSVGTSLFLFLANGTYTYEGNGGNYTALSGTLNVTGATTRAITLTFPVAYSVVFRAPMIPPGLFWYITIERFGNPYYTSLESYTSNNVSALIPSGSYNYTASFLGKSVTHPFTISASTTINVVFPWMYNLTFIQSGLPSGSQWYVNFTDYYSGPLFSSSYTVELFNGTYNYCAQTSIQGYAPKSGTAYILGNSKTYTISFTTNSVSSYTVTLIPKGLPSGTLWYAGLSNNSGVKTLKSGSGDITFTEYNGSYTYNVSTSNKDFTPSSFEGTLAVSGSSVSETINFVPVKNIIMFEESGLPPYVTWFVNITGSNGTLRIEGTGNLSSSVTNGSYTFTVASGDRSYAPSIHNGEFTMSGNKVIELVTFTSIKYVVSFNVSGLPSGSIWMINITNGISLSSTNTSISTTLMNGTYTYTSSNSTFFYPLIYRGTFTIEGHSITVSVQYIHYSYITGSVVPTNAIVIMNGMQIQVISGVFNKSVAEGSYQIVVSETGYKSYFGNVTISQADQVIHITVNLTKLSTPPTSSPVYVYAAISAVIALLAIAGIIVYIRKK